MSLPRRMMQVGVSVTASETAPEHHANGLLILSPLDYGITERLQVSDALSLRYTFLDDAPAGSSTGRRDPISLAVRAGVYGIGYSDSAGLIASPVVIFHVRKHLGPDAYLWGVLSWSGEWTDGSGQSRLSPTLYRGDFTLSSDRKSSVWLRGGISFGFARHMTFDTSLTGEQWHACTIPTCRWAMRSATLALGPSYRWRPWLTLGLEGELSLRWRPYLQSGIVTPDEPVPLVPRQWLAWMQLLASATFSW